MDIVNQETNLQNTAILPKYTRYANEFPNIIVPHIISKQAISGKSSTYLQVFVVLKYHTSGHIRITSDIVREIAYIIGRTEKTVSNALKTLREKSWIVANKETGYTRIKSFKKILNVKYFHGSRLYLNKINKTREWCYSTCISSIVEKNNWFNRRYARQSASKKDVNIRNHSTKSAYIPFKYGYNQIPNKHSARVLGKCVSTIQSNIKKSEMVGFLFITPKYRKIEYYHNKALFIKSIPYIQEPNKIESSIEHTFKRTRDPEILKLRKKPMERQ